MKNIINNKLLTLNILVILLLGLFFSGCSQKIQIRAIKSAKVATHSIKHIGVSPFKNDDISQSSQIDSAIANVSISGKKYFTLIDRDNIDKIMSEKKLNDSGLVDLLSNDSVSGLSQMQALLTGEVNISDMTSSHFRETRTDYDTCIKHYMRKGKEYCSKYKKYNVNCMANTYNVVTKIKLIKINDATTIFTDTYKESEKHKHCTDDNIVLPSKKYLNSKLAKKIANRLVRDIAPSYIYHTITLLDDEDVNFNNEQDRLFENALKMIAHDRIEKANNMLTTLNKQLNDKSYVVLYDLSVTEESLGNIDKAYKILKKSEDIAIIKDGIVDEISIGIKRLQRSISEKEKAQNQI